MADGIEDCVMAFDTIPEPIPSTLPAVETAGDTITLTKAELADMVAMAAAAAVVAHAEQADVQAAALDAITPHGTETSTGTEE